MSLESLLDLVQELSKRIDKHRETLRASESLTRYSLIDPLLRELGWDTGDPDQVRPEYPLRTEYNPGTKSADYALLSNGRPAMMVEAKKLGTPLQDAVLTQGINYCQVEGTKYFAVTDGCRWEIYETHRAVPIEEKRILVLDLSAPDVAETCLKAIALWRPSLRSSQINVGEAPVVTRGRRRDVGPGGSSGGPPPPDGLGKDDWQPLAAIVAAPGQKPVEMLFPDDTRTPMKSWRSGPVEVVRWLMGRRIMSANDCPVKLRSRKAFRYLVNTQPVHSNGSPFTSPIEVNGLHIELHDNLTALVSKTKLIVERVGQDPAQFKVRFS